MFHVTGLCKLWLRLPYFPAKSSVLQSAGRLHELTLENVWEALKDGQWESKTELGAAAGIDEDTVTLIINLLHHWNLVDVQGTPELLVRRKLNAISPIVILQLLGSIAEEKTSPKVQLIAERVACRSCGGKQLNFTGHNEVECGACHEKQWKVLELRESQLSIGRTHQLEG